MFKKICAVFLLMLVRVYDAWGSCYLIPDVLFMEIYSCVYSGASLVCYGVGTVGTSEGCKDLCSDFGYRGYNYSCFSQINSNYGNSFWNSAAIRNNCENYGPNVCACYRTPSVTDLSSSCGDQLDCTETDCVQGQGYLGLSSVASTYGGMGEWYSGSENFVRKGCTSKICEGAYETYMEKWQRRKWQYCSRGLGCVIDSSYFDYRCNSGYYGSVVQRILESAAPSCMRCASTDGVYYTSTPGENIAASKCFLGVGDYSGITGNFTITSKCYVE